MNNSRFSVSLHILTLLELAGGERLSSEYIAGSININPVLVRKELSNLRNHGFVESKEGKGGGATLAQPAKDIRLADIYLAVSDRNILGNHKNDPNPNCPVGKQINTHLNELYTKAEQALIDNLSGKNLSDFCKKFS